MKCHICNYDIPAGKKFCPGCGRILSVAEQQKIGSNANKVSEDTIVYRPASTGKKKISSSDQGINNIFNTTPDTPEYKTELAQNRATADVVEYDRMFMSRTNNIEDTYEDEADYSDLSDTRDLGDITNQETDKGFAIKQEYDDNSEDGESETKKLPFDIKKIIITIALVAGLIIIVTAVYQIGERIGLWGETETQSQSAEEEKTLGEKAPIVKEPDSTTASPTSDYKIGIYTVTSTEKIVFMQKSATDDRVIATVPNGTVIEITEISDDMGKATFGTYTGWLNLDELSYTPDAKLSGDETTTKEPETTFTVSEENNTPEAPETTTEKKTPDSPGNYTVDLQGDGTYLNVRDAGSTDGAVVTVIDDGIQVTVDKVENGWGHITTPDGNEGWIYMIYLKQ